MNMDVLRELFEAVNDMIRATSESLNDMIRATSESLNELCTQLVNIIKIWGRERGTGRAYRQRRRADPDALYRTIRVDAGTRRAPIAAYMRWSTAATGV